MNVVLILDRWTRAIVLVSPKLPVFVLEFDVWAILHFWRYVLWRTPNEMLRPYRIEHRRFGVGPRRIYRIYQRVTTEGRKTFCRLNYYWYCRLLIGSGHRASFDEVDGYTRIPDGYYSVTIRTLKTYRRPEGEGQEGWFAREFLIWSARTLITMAPLHNLIIYVCRVSLCPFQLTNRTAERFFGSLWGTWLRKQWPNTQTEWVMRIKYSSCEQVNSEKGQFIAKKKHWHDSVGNVLVDYDFHLTKNNDLLSN